MDASTILLLMFIGDLSVIAIVFFVLRLVYPPIAPMVIEDAQHEFIVRRYRDQ